MDEIGLSDVVVGWFWMLWFMLCGAEACALHLKRNLHAFHVYLRKHKMHAFYAINVYHNYMHLAPIILVRNLRNTFFMRVSMCNYVPQLCPLHLGCIYTKDKCGAIMACTNLSMLCC